MTAHFSVNCDPGELSVAEFKLGRLHEFLGQEGARLGRLQSDSPGWTGVAATACLAETARLSGVLTKETPKIEAAMGAIRTFRVALDEVASVTLPRLNSRWEQCESDYAAQTRKAGHVYATEIGGHRGAVDQEAGRIATGVRDRALDDASVSQAGARRNLDVDYHAMVASLEHAAQVCGAALAQAVPITFSADQWTKVRGGQIPMGMLASLRSQVFGKDSFVGRSDAVKAGEYVASRLDDQAKHGTPGDRLDPETLALLTQMKGDAGFAEALLTDLGPGGAAFLSLRARGLFESSGDRGDQEQGRQLIGILTDVFATGSHVEVATGNGQSRPLMDRAWLDRFNPEAYDSAGQGYQNSFMVSGFVHGYRPDVLLPFLNKKGALSSDFSQMVGQRALEDYEKAMGSGHLDQGALERWSLYRGDDDPTNGAAALKNVLAGDSSDPFRSELFHVALDRVGEHAFASNSVMMTHRDTMLALMTGKENQLTGGQNGHDWASKGLAAILKQATVGSQGSNVTSADAALWGVADYLTRHRDEHMVKNVQLALGAVVTDPRFMDGALTSVTGPFGTDGAIDGFVDDPNHPKTGPLMSEKLWAGLHQEAMRQPKTAAKIIREVGTYINAKLKETQDLGHSWDASAKNGKGDWVQNQHVTSLDMYQAAAAQHFLGSNLKASIGAIEAELERALEEQGKQKDLAKDMLGSLVGAATDPSSVMGDVAGRLTSLAIGTAVDAAMPSDDIHERYDGKIKALDTMLNDDVLKTDYWATTQAVRVYLIKRIMLGDSSTDVAGLQQGLEGPLQDPLRLPRDVGPTTYDGDPRAYIGLVSGDPSQGGGGPPQTNDFLTYGPKGLPDGLKEARDMNPAEREAYLNWLHDPAVQTYVGNWQAEHSSAVNGTPTP